jgi:hypothetical protein
LERFSICLPSFLNLYCLDQNYEQRVVNFFFFLFEMKNARADCVLKNVGILHSAFSSFPTFVLQVND